jgi:hypothetical protein
VGFGDFFAPKNAQKWQEMNIPAEYGKVVQFFTIRKKVF